MGGCQNYGPFLGPYYNTAPNIFDKHPNGKWMLCTIVCTPSRGGCIGFRAKGLGFGSKVPKVLAGNFFIEDYVADYCRGYKGGYYEFRP